MASKSILTRRGFEREQRVKRMGNQPPCFGGEPSLVQPGRPHEHIKPTLNIKKQSNKFKVFNVKSHTEGQTNSKTTTSRVIYKNNPIAYTRCSICFVSQAESEHSADSLSLLLSAGLLSPHVAFCTCLTQGLGSTCRLSAPAAGFLFRMGA